MRTEQERKDEFVGGAVERGEERNTQPQWVDGLTPMARAVSPQQEAVVGWDGQSGTCGRDWVLV